MELDNIEKLIEKYFEASTTVAEEETLRTYFSQESVATHLEKYTPMFHYFSNAKKERFTKQVPLKPRRKKYKWISAVAAIAICAGFYFNELSTIENEYTAEEIAVAKEALSLLSVNFNKGAEKISHLTEFEKKHEQIFN